MTDHEAELFNQLAEDEGILEAVKAHEEAIETIVHGSEEDENCGVCAFKNALDEILMLGHAFDANEAGDEEFVSPLDFALNYVSEGAQDGFPLVAMIQDAIGTLSKLAMAATYAGWNLEKQKANERGEQFGCDHDHEEEE